MLLRFTTTFWVFLLTASAAWAQLNSLERAAERMRTWDYVTAIQLYRQILDRENSVEARLNLAECYRRVNDMVNAEAQYAEIVKLPQARPLHALYYAQALQVNGKCAEAQRWFERYAAEAPYDGRGRNLAAACPMQAELLERGQAMYRVFPTPVNSTQNDYAPVLYGSRLVFASERHEAGPMQRTNLWNGGGFARLHGATLAVPGASPDRFVYGATEKFADDPTVKFHEAGAAFAPDDKTIYITCSNIENGQPLRTEEGLINLGIFMRRPGVPDDQPRRLNLVSPNYSMAYPTISADGKQLYFASNMPGGFGGLDLYVSQWEDGRWGLPVNLGPAINTEGNELYPFVDKSGRLYFASNGHAGLGGLDLFFSVPAGKGEWSAPVNLGAPMNSTHDDFGITFAASLGWGFFCSNRPGGAGGDDIYAFTKRAAAVEVLVADARTRKPLSGAEVRLGQRGPVIPTGAEGRVVFDLPLDSCVVVSVVKKEYENGEALQACARGLKAGESVQLNTTLRKEERFVLTGFVFDMVDGLPAEGAHVYLISDCGNATVDSAVTRADGRYRFTRLRRNCCYTAKAVMEGYIAERSEANCANDPSGAATYYANLNLQPYRDADGFIVATEKEATNLAVKIADNAGGNPYHYNEGSGLYETPEGNAVDADLPNGLRLRGGILFDDNGDPIMPGRSKWKKSESGEGFLVHLYYDLDAVQVRSESVAELEKLRQMLRENPDLSVEIASHTDARGSAEYNKQLSQRRAQAVVDWLVANGVPRHRLAAHGYGESRPVNECKDDYPCSEAEYQLNRRTEFKVVGSAKAAKR
jgi:outer membrane protein OmpA-like peptidoglycan-associated protein